MDERKNECYHALSHQRASLSLPSTLNGIHINCAKCSLRCILLAVKPMKLQHVYAYKCTLVHTYTITCIKKAILYISEANIHYLPNCRHRQRQLIFFKYLKVLSIEY